MNFKDNLDKQLKIRGWTLARLAKECGVSKSTLHSWTTGRSALNLEKLKLVATALEISIHELVFGEPDPFEKPGDEILKEIFRGDVRVNLHRIERRRK